MAITLKDIQQAVGENSALLTEILSTYEQDAIKHLGTKGFTARTKKDDEDFITNHLKQNHDAIAAQIVSGIHKAYDEDFEKLFGEKKKNDEKSYDAYKRKIGELQAKITELQAAKSTDSILKEQLSTLQATVEKMKVEHAAALEAKDNDILSREHDMELESGLRGLTIAIPAHITTDEQKQAYVEKQRKMIKSDFSGTYKASKDKDGNFVYYKDDKPLLNPKDGKPLKAADLLSDNYADYFVKQGRQQSGSGSGKKREDGTPVCTTIEEVHEAVKSMGFKEGTNDFTKKYSEIKAKNGLI